MSRQKVLLCSAGGQTVILWKRGWIEKSEKIDTFWTNLSVSPTVLIDIDQSSKGSEREKRLFSKVRKLLEVCTIRNLKAFRESSTCDLPSGSSNPEDSGSLNSKRLKIFHRHVWLYLNHEINAIASVLIFDKAVSNVVQSCYYLWCEGIILIEREKVLLWEPKLTEGFRGKNPSWRSLGQKYAQQSSACLGKIHLGWYQMGGGGCWAVLLQCEVGPRACWLFGPQLGSQENPNFAARNILGAQT